MAGKNRCDLSRLFADSFAFRALVDRLAEPFASDRITHVVGIDAMGFALAAAVALKLNAGFVPLRKQGKAAWDVRSFAFIDYSGNEKSLEIVVDTLDSTACVVIVDDWSETGAQLAATMELCSSTGATVAGMAVLNADDAARRHPSLASKRLHCVTRY
jgi:adenine phosphoribosyltransferase